MRYAIVSRTAKKDNYLIICFLPHTIVFSRLARELSYLYPFKFSTRKKKPFNIEDFNFLIKYNINFEFKLFHQTNKKSIVLNTPYIYDLDEMINLYSVLKPIYIEKNSNVCIIFPENNILQRGRILKNIIKYGPKYFVLLGDNYGENRDSLSTLMCRYILTCGVKSENIIKIKENDTCDSILESKELISVFFKTDDKTKIMISCSRHKIQNIAKTVRKMRKNGILKEKINYIC